MNIQIKHDFLPGAQQVIDLFVDVGWGGHEDYDYAVWETALRNTHTIVTAVDGNKLVGMARFSSDNTHETHMFEIIVHPQYQRKGIGRSMMQRADELFPDSSMYIGGFAKNEKFFQACGFTPREQMKVFTRRKLA